VRILIDMNLSPVWVQTFEARGIEAAHWSDIGAHDATDAEIMRHAREQGFVVFTLDLDFTAALAHSRAIGPSIVQLRTQDVLPDTTSPLVLRALRQFEDELAIGALVTIDVARSRVRLLPLK
jgi:predicted nuclease of predicted toxin-antitoxin system